MKGFNLFISTIKSSTSLLGGLTTALLNTNSSILKSIGGLLSLATGMETAATGTKGLTAALNALEINPIVLGLSAVIAIASLAKGLSDSINAKIEESSKKGQEAISTYKEMQSALQEDKKTIDSISEEYYTLSKGVDDLGHNVSLTSDEYDRYKDITADIANRFPELIQGYNDENEVILRNKGSIEELTKAYEDKAETARKSLIADANNIYTNAKSEDTVEYKNEFGLESFVNGDNAQLDTSAVINAGKKIRDILLKAIQDGNKSFSTEEINSLFANDMFSKAFFQQANIDSKDFFESQDDYIERLKTSLSTINAQILTLQSGQENILVNLKSTWLAFLPDIEEYKGLSEQAKNIVQSFINDLDYSTVTDEIGGFDKVVGYVTDNIIKPLQQVDGDIDFKTLIELKTQLNNGDCTPGEYQEKLNAILKLIENSPLLNDSQKDEIKKSINIAFGLNLDDDISYEQATKTIEEKLRNSAEASSKAAQEMQDEFGLGNVDLTIRPRVDWTEMKKAGYDVEEGSYSTVDSTSFLFGTDEGVLNVHATPILPDGTVMSPTELADYVDKIVSQGGNILENDTKGIVLKVDQWDDLTEEDIENKTQKYKDYIKAADDWDIALHNAQASYYDSYDKSWNKTKSDFTEINKYISSLSLEDIKIAYKIIQSSDSEMSLDELKREITLEKANNIEIKSFSDIYDEIKDKAKLVATAEKEMSDNGVVATDTMASLISEGLATENQFTKTAKGFTLSKTAIQQMNNAAKQSYQNDLNNAKKAANAVIEAEGGKALAISATTDEYLKQLKALQASIYSEAYQKEINKLGGSHDAWAITSAANAGLKASAHITSQISALENAATNYTKVNDAYNAIQKDVERSGSGKSSSKNETAGDKALKAWEAKKKEWKHKLEMGQMSEADYHYTLHVNYKKDLKNYSETLDERRAMEEDWYKWQATNAQNTWNLNEKAWKHQLEMGEISEASYYAAVKKYYKKILGNYEETLDQRRQIEEELHQWEITNAQNTWNEQNNAKKHALTMGEITEKQYYNWVKANYKKMLGTYKETLDERRSIEEDYYNWCTEQETKRLELIQTKLDGTKSAIDDLLEEEIDRLNEQKDAVEKAYQAEIDALQEKNEEKEKEIDLEEKALALAKSRNQRTVMQYTAQGMRYVADKTEVKSAQKDYDDALLQQKIDYLEKQKENAAQAFESQIEVYNRYKDLWQDAVDAQQKAQNKMYANTQLWANWEQAALQGNIDLLNDFINKYNQASKNVELDAVKNNNSDLTQAEVNTKYTLIPDVVDATKLQTAMADFKDSINTLINGNLKKITEEFNTSQNITTKATSNVFNGGITINKPISDVDSLSRAIIEKLPMYMSQYCGS